MNKGFSLVELVVVIAILAIIALISIPIVNGVINDSKEKAYKEQENAIVSAARTHMVSNASSLPKSSGDNVCITVQQLKTEGLLKESNIKNPVGANYKTATNYKERNANFDGGVLVMYNDSKYTYTYVDHCN